MDVGGVKGESRRSTFLPGRRPLPPHRNFTYHKVLGGPVEDRGQAFYIKGALNIFYFLKELFVNFTYTGKLLKNVFNFVMFTNGLFTSYLLK